MRELYSDLAIEACENITDEYIQSKNELINGINVSYHKILHDDNSVGKATGDYYTLELSDFLKRKTDSFTRSTDAIKQILDKLIKPSDKKSILIVGLGNRAITPDALGGKTIDSILVTKHLIESEPQHFSSFTSVSAVAPGVLGTTGIETASIIKALRQKTKASLIIAIDALACKTLSRLCTTVQITDTGISPGSGVSNARNVLNKDTMGAKVIAIGVPTVVDGRNLESLDENVIVTTKDISRQIEDIAKVLAYSINLSMQDGFTIEDIESLIS